LKRFRDSGQACALICSLVRIAQGNAIHQLVPFCALCQDQAIATIASLYTLDCNTDILRCCTDDKQTTAVVFCVTCIWGARLAESEQDIMPFAQVCAHVMIRQEVICQS
jgi:hypothetical protein